MTNDDDLIAIFASASKHLKSHLPALIEANPPPQIVHRYIEAWLIVSALINDLGEEDRHPQIVRHQLNDPPSLQRALDEIQHSLQLISQKLGEREAD